MSTTPTPETCRRCLGEILTVYRFDDDADLGEALPLLTPGDAQDALLLRDAVDHGRTASLGTPATCASCGAVYGA